MPDDVAFSHVSAAQLQHLPLPSLLESQVLLDVTRPTSMAQIRRAGCRGHRGLERREVIGLDGLRVVGLADTWCDLGELSAREMGVDDLVVVRLERRVAARRGPVWHKHRVIGEYQGADHASRKRRSADSSRIGLAGDQDHTVIEIYAEDVYGRARRRTLLRRFARTMKLDPTTLRIE